MKLSHRYSASEWELFIRFSRSEVRGTRLSVYRCVNAVTAEAYVSTVWRQGSVVLLVILV